MIRKREKIHQQNSALEATGLQRDKSILDVRQRLDQQRDKYQELERKEDQQSADLLAATMSAAGTRKKNKHAPSSPNDANANSNTNANATAAAYNQTEGEAVAKKPRVDVDDLERRQEELEKKQEEVLTREFKTNIDYAMFPKMILQKAKALNMGTETIKTEVTRLEAILQGTTTNYQREQEQRYDTGTTGGGGGAAAAAAATNTAMMENEDGGKFGEESTTTFENTMVDESRLLQEERPMETEGGSVAVEMAYDKHEHGREYKHDHHHESNNNNDEGVVMHHQMLQNAEFVTKNHRFVPPVPPTTDGE